MEVPGPGTYDGVNSNLTGLLSSGSHLPTPDSAFTSTAARGAVLEPGRFRPPGPAYYSPDTRSLSPKRSYHLNVRKHWVGL